MMGHKLPHHSGRAQWCGLDDAAPERPFPRTGLASRSMRAARLPIMLQNACSRQTRQILTT